VLLGVLMLEYAWGEEMGKHVLGQCIASLLKVVGIRGTNQDLRESQFRVTSLCALTVKIHSFYRNLFELYVPHV
jgi:hypothetical protein